MKTYNNIYPEIYSMKNLVLAWKKARKGKTKKGAEKSDLSLGGLDLYLWYSETGKVLK